MDIKNWQEPKEEDKYYIIDGPIKIKTDNDDIDPLLGKLYAEYIQQTLNAYCPRIEIINWYDLDSKEFKLKENDEAVIKIALLYYPPFEFPNDIFYMAQWFYKDNLIISCSNPKECDVIFELKTKFIEWLDILFFSNENILGDLQKEIKQYLSSIIEIIKPGIFEQI